MCSLGGFVPQPEESRPVPARAGNRKGDLREAPVGFAIPDKAVSVDRYALHLAVPFAAECGTRPQLRNRLAKAHGASPGFLRGLRSIEEAPALSIKVTKTFGLELIGQHPEHEMAGQVRRRWPPKDQLPTPAKCIDVQIAQTRNLNVKFVLVWRRRTDPDPWHGA